MNDQAHPHPRTISDVLGFGPALLLFLAFVALFAVVAPQPRPALTVSDEAPAFRTYCVGNDVMIVTERGRHDTGAVC